MGGFVHSLMIGEFGWINEFGLVLPPLIHGSDITNIENTGFFIQKEKGNTKYRLLFRQHAKFTISI